MIVPVFPYLCTVFNNLQNYSTMRNLFMTKKQSLKTQRRNLVEMIQAGSNGSELVESFCRYYEDFSELRGNNPYGSYKDVMIQMYECIIISLECMDMWDNFNDAASMSMFLMDMYGAALRAVDNYADELKIFNKQKALTEA